MQILTKQHTHPTLTSTSPSHSQTSSVSVPPLPLFSILFYISAYKYKLYVYLRAMYQAPYALCTYPQSPLLHQKSAGDISFTHRPYNVVHNQLTRLH